MKVTWSDEMALAWRLFAISVSSSSLKGGPVHSHPRADVDVFARRYRGGAEEDAAATPVVATYDLDRVLTAVGDSAIERHGSTLIAIRRIHWPGVVVPAVLKVSGDLGQSERDKRRQDAESSPCQHAGGGEEKVKEENVKGTWLHSRTEWRMAGISYLYPPSPNVISREIDPRHWYRLWRGQKSAALAI